jgi:hypothetical protein
VLQLGFVRGNSMQTSHREKTPETGIKMKVRQSGMIFLLAFGLLACHLASPAD